jgi:hypothetical protein
MGTPSLVVVPAGMAAWALRATPSDRGGAEPGERK